MQTGIAPWKPVVDFLFALIEHCSLSACDFVMGLGKPQLRANFEVASFHHCRNIKGNPHTFRELP